jgi:2-aminoethylphosphonate dioxygenase
MSGYFSQEQRDFFHSNGYLHIPAFFDSAIVSHLRKISDEMSSRAATLVQRSIESCVSLSTMALANVEELIVVAERDKPQLVCRYEYMLGSNERFKAYVERSLLPVLTDLTGTSMRAFKDKTNEKLPGGGAFGPHQDIEAYRHFPAQYHVTAMISIDRSTLANGCLQFAQNWMTACEVDGIAVAAQLQGRYLLPSQEGGPHHGELMPEIANKLIWRAVETAPADLVLFDSFVPHRSEANHTNGGRRAIFVTCAATNDWNLYNSYYAEKRRAYNDPKFHVGTPTTMGPM